jgi:uncharacterized protein (DUF1800 family)
MSSISTSSYCVRTAAAVGASTALAACGGGGSGEAPAAAAPAPPSGPASPATVTDATAARFLVQASTGFARAAIDRVRALGYAGWLDEQFTMPRGQTRWDWLIEKGYDAATYRNGQNGFDAVAWRHLIASPDTLRQRVTLALSEIVVVGLDGVNTAWRAFAGAAWLDLLESHAFGNVRGLLQDVSTSLQMGVYLTYRGNAKANAATGTVPDENYARELMQLFTIGLTELNDDGTPRLVGGQPVETYGQDDITGLARVFTGWDQDLAGGNTDRPDYHRRPMTQVAARYETGAKTFLGITVAAGATAASGLTAALDRLFAHPNIGPFWARQLIQRLVTSNPSPAYVQRVARVFANDGQGVRGNLRAVVRAILLDDEARSDASLSSTTAGKLREPILRLTAWARAFGATSPSDAWAIGITSNPGTALGQSPLRSPSVFNFFRPGYVPPGSSLAALGLVAPEFQIANESSVVGYLNYMQTTIASGRGDVRADYTSWVPLADDPPALVAQLDLLLAGGQLELATRSMITTTVGAMTTGSDTARRNRLYAAILLVMASPEFLVPR